MSDQAHILALIVVWVLATALVPLMLPPRPKGRYQGSPPASTSENTDDRV